MLPPLEKIAGLLATSVGMVLCAQADAQNAAPYAPPRILPVPAQRAGDVLILGSSIPVWVVPNEPDVASGRPVAAPSPNESSIPPPPRRARSAFAIEGAETSVEWRQPVSEDGTSVPLADALVRIAPPGVVLDTSVAPVGRLLTPVSWFGGDSRGNTAAALLAAAGLRGRVEGSRLTIVLVGTAEASATAAQWRARGDELLAQYQAARLEESVALQTELAAQKEAQGAALRAAQRAEDVLALREQAKRAREDEPSPRIFVVRTWTVSPDDRTLRGALARWAGIEGMELLYGAEWDWPIQAERQFTGALPQVVEALVTQLPNHATQIKVRISPTLLAIETPR